MQNCPNCGRPVEEENRFCPGCGAALGGAQQAPEGYYRQDAGYQNPGYNAQPQAYDPYDHTAEFDPEDISRNKVYAMLVYLLGIIGVIVALLACGGSSYAEFHVRQALKFTACEVLLGICAAVLCWTIIVPIAAGVLTVIFLVLEIICFFQVCSGKAKEPPIIRSLGFLR